MSVQSNNPTQPVSGTVTVLQGSPPWTVKPDGTGWTLTGTSANVNVTNFPATQPISGSITANIGTTGGLALDTSVNGLLLAAGAAFVAQPGPLMMGVVATSNPTPTTGQLAPVSIVAANGSVRVQAIQGANGGMVNAWWVKHTDGTNGPVAVKAASTPAVAADEALVVAVSPNNSVAVTGTFFQGTQPVSGTVTANQGSPPWTVKPDGTGWSLTGTSANVNVTNFPATQTIAGTVTVSTITTMPALVAGAATIGKVDILGNAGATLDAANGGAVPTNGLQVGGGSVAGGTTFEVLTVKAASVAAAATDTSLVVQPLVGSHVMNTAAAGTQLVGVVGSGAAVMDAITTAATTPVNGLATLGAYVTTKPALTTGQSVALQVDATGALMVNKDSRRSTYSATSSFVPLASATLPIWAMIGSATKTIRITHIRADVYCTVGTALPGTLTLGRLSALTGGTAVAVGSMPHDSANAAATAVASTYAGGLPASVTAGFQARTGFLQWVTGGATVAQPTSTLDWYFGDDGGQQLVLRGTSQWFALILSSVGTTPVMEVTVEWVEDNS